MKRLTQVTLILVSLILIPACLTGVTANVTNKKEMAQVHNPILFLHGGFRTNADWITMKGWFEADGWPQTALYAYTFADYDKCTFQANVNNAKEIKKWVDAILNETGVVKLDFVAHSMGGLSGRYYIKFLAGIDKVDDFVSLASPHHSGTPCGPIGVDNVTLLLNEGDATPGGILNDTLGARIDPITGVTYNSTHIPGTINYTSIYSRDDELCPYSSSPLDGAYNIEVEGLSHVGIRLNKSVYELVKAAVDDPLLPTTTPPSTTTTTLTTTMTGTTTTEESQSTPGYMVIVAILSITVIVIWKRFSKFS